MNLQNDYKVLYEKAADGKRTFLASKIGAFADAEAIAEFEIGKYKLVYEKGGKIYCSESGVPTEDDYCSEAFDKVFVEATYEPVVEEPVQDAHADAIATNVDSHGKLSIDGNVVTLKATGTIKPATNTNGNTYHHVGFKMTAPNGIDPVNVVITRPDGKTRIMANILDGANYTNMYWQPTENDRVFTYYIDWNNDGVNDLTVIIDASEATLVSEEAVAE
jgi:hypothetical protein